MTWRHLSRHKTYTALNVLGLALGIASFVLIGGYTRFERSFDRMHAPNIYRVESRFYRGNDMTDDWPTSTNGYAPAIKDNLSGIASYTRINWYNSERVVRYGEVKFREEHVCYADSNFFSFFAYPLLKGDPATVLREVNTIVLSASAARKYFGQADPMGRILDVSTEAGTLHCAVTGVFKDIPSNSTMQFSFLISWATTPEWLKRFWYMHESYTFVQLTPGADIHAIEAGFPAVAERYKTGPALKDLRWAIHLVPLPDIHLNPAKSYEIEVKGNRFAIDLLDVIAYLILLIACVNYINLATTKALDRAREVGIRKVSGALPAFLVAQFLAESAGIFLCAAFLALPVVAFSGPWLVEHFGVSGFLFDWMVVLRIAVLLTVAALASGIYPALVLVRLQPAIVLKGRFTFSARGVRMRKAMVAFQFGASLVLIAGTIAVYRQMDFMSRQNTGVRLAQTVVVKAPGAGSDLNHKMPDAKTAFLALPGVISVTASGAVPGKEVATFGANRRYGAPKSDERLYEMLRVDHDFIDAYGLQLVAGRGFDITRPGDSTGVVLNESAVRQFGFASPAAAVGQKVWLETIDSRPDVVLGVVRDYHQQSLQKPFTPIVLCMDPKLGWVPVKYFSIKIASTDAPALLKPVWDRFFPESSFDFFYLDDFYSRQYRQEIQFSRTILVFSSLAILIACMGLLGLTAYTTARRTKEIGVRKVLGASVRHILGLLTWDVVRLILWCSLGALPLAFLVIRRWLDGYAFRAPLTWWQWVVPVVVLVFIALGTTGWLSFRAAVARPVDSLKEE
ncbi:ABC transporter permease [Dinghuibacter silviterrae]|uniref:ABC transporter permease n=1 Tax=Dinghuibacter silviterrae TaxID=1539049 RepID=UPI0013C316E5|nr:ABC transporter permease [Dinghuibacter silviterrae]